MSATSTLAGAPPMLVLFDRDGTLVDDVPYNGDPALVRALPGAIGALSHLRRRGIAVGMVSNQSGIARGLIDRLQVDRGQREGGVPARTVRHHPDLPPWTLEHLRLPKAGPRDDLRGGG